MQEEKHLLHERGLARWKDWRGEDRPDLYSIVRETCAGWLRFRAAKAGFYVDAYQQHSERNGQLRFSTVDFGGELTVTDPAVFVEALRNGIGPAKAFGCGLLLVRRAPG